MNDNQRLQLQNLINEHNVQDNTNTIRELKHSQLLRKDVEKMVHLRERYKNDATQLQLESMLECQFLSTYYTDIYNKIRKDEIDLLILFQALDVLQDIEEGKLDQHTGSFQFGQLLKEIYVDSALKKADKLNAELESQEPKFRSAEVELTWAQYKNYEKHKKSQPQPQPQMQSQTQNQEQPKPNVKDRYNALMREKKQRKPKQK